MASRVALLESWIPVEDISTLNPRKDEYASSNSGMFGIAGKK
jgi:hypothetical protein